MNTKGIESQTNLIPIFVTDLDDSLSCWLCYCVYIHVCLFLYSYGSISVFVFLFIFAFRFPYSFGDLDDSLSLVDCVHRIHKIPLCSQAGKRRKVFQMTLFWDFRKRRKVFQMSLFEISTFLLVWGTDGWSINVVKRVFLCLKFFLKLFGRKRSLGFVDQECIKEMFLFVNSFSFLDEKNHQVSGLRTLFVH